MTDGEREEQGIIADLRTSFSHLGDAVPEPGVEAVRSTEPEEPADAALDPAALALIDDLLRVAAGSPSSSAPAAGAPSRPDTSAVASATVRILQHGTVRFDAGEAFTIGRAEGPGRYAIAIPELSRGHVRVEMTHDGLTATDLGSTNGTALVVRGGETQMKANLPVRLEAGSRLVVAHAHSICEVLSVDA